MVTNHASHDRLQAVTADEPSISKHEGPEQPTAEENEHCAIGKGGAPVMRSKEDDLSVWQTVRRYKVVSVVAMAAAFSAALDGYQINLNGGLVSNEGFIRQMASPGTTIIEGQYVSAWSGIQSSGQAVGQISIFIESFATRWDHWLVAKLFSGMGVGMLQSTLPIYLSEIAPTQLRGFFINAYSFWFVVGQIFASVALNRLHAISPLDFRTPIYTQWAMVGATIIIFVIMPETPWWLVSKGKLDRAAEILTTYNGRVEGYDVSEQICELQEIMSATVAEERRIAERDSQEGMWAVFQGRNFIRFVIAGWPKVTQQFVGLAVFNSNATYFFQYAGNKDPFLVTVILSCVQLLSMIITAMLTDQIGRRPLTVYPYAVTTLSVLCLGIIGCFDYTQKSTSSLLVFFACLATFTTTGASSIGYAYAAEIPQQRLRAQTAGWSLAASNLIALMFSFCTPLMINGPLTKWGVKTGFFFAGTGTVAVIIAWFILPEVTRRTPAEIDEMFEKKINLRKFKHYVTDVQTNAFEQHELETHTRTA
ncbi:hexose transporter [Aspergillus bombycis]|uniref:Hexose transporter n=1 Tax=Aspergillus bombycis TaxID=109264 RepID=A0A1F8AB29_9EURO|nr:hexose transporter [Aspergillus bombycis]OGM48645.1 hexose transporter [Aspergillus bombycis]